MGIKIVGSFTTPEGFAYTDLYLRITSITVYSNKPTSNIHFAATAYLSREAYDNGKSGLSSPVPTAISTTVPFEEISTLVLMRYVYYYYSEWLKWKGFAVEAVLEAGQELYVPPQSLVFMVPEPTVVPTPGTSTFPILGPASAPAPADEVSPQSSEPTQ
jgi:hypothetical protein